MPPSESDKPMLPATDDHYSKARTVVYALLIIAVSWIYLLAGSLPGAVGDMWREWLLSNPANPSINMAFVILEAGIPILLAFRHGRNRWRLALIIVGSYPLAVVIEWAMRAAIHSWAPLEQPPYNFPLWSAHNLIFTLIIVTITTFVAAGWRRGRNAQTSLSK